MTLQSQARGDKSGARQCSRCRRVLPLHAMTSNSRRILSYCRPCSTQLQREYRARRRATPEGAERMRQQRRQWSKSYRQRHPERYRAIQRRAWRAYWERIMADPERHRVMLENRRIDERLRRERAGESIRPVPKVKKGCYVFLDPEPLLAVIPLVKGRGKSDPLTRALYRITHGESARVELGVVDEVAIRIGLMPHDLYPELTA